MHTEDDFQGFSLLSSKERQKALILKEDFLEVEQESTVQQRGFQKGKTSVAAFTPRVPFTILYPCVSCLFLLWLKESEDAVYRTGLKGGHAYPFNSFPFFIVCYFNIFCDSIFCIFLAFS